METLAIPISQKQLYPSTSFKPTNPKPLSTVHAGLKPSLKLIDLFEDAVVLLDEDFTLYGFNKTMLNNSEISGLFSVDEDSKVSLKDQQHQTQLQKAYLKMSRKKDKISDNKVTFILHDQHLYYQVTIQECLFSSDHEMNSQQLPSLMVNIKDVNQSRIPQKQTFMETFGLTDSEADICRYLCLGYEINQIAEIRFVSKHTVRHQMKSIFQKTHIQKQSQLVSYLLSICMR